MPIDLVSRVEWGARSPRGSYSRVSSTRGVKVHYTGGRVDPRIVDDHDRCAALVRSIQNSHMDGNGWMDIGYSMVVCPHQKVFVGRGPGRLPAANGPGLNSGHYAVLGLVGSSGLVTPPDGMLHGLRDAIEWLRAEGKAGSEIRGHRDGYATACPGDALYGWVRRGAPRPKKEKGEEMTGDALYKAVWEQDRMKVPYARPDNPTWKPASVLVNHGEWLRRIDAKLDAQNAIIRELAAALEQRDEAIDVEALVRRIETAIESVTVRLDVPDPA